MMLGNLSIESFYRAQHDKWNQEMPRQKSKAAQRNSAGYEPIRTPGNHDLTMKEPVERSGGKMVAEKFASTQDDERSQLTTRVMPFQGDYLFRKTFTSGNRGMTSAT